MWVGLIQPIQGLDKRKKAKREVLLLDCFGMGHQSFSARGLELKHRLFLGLEPAGFQTGSYTVGSLDSQARGLGLEL